MCLNHDIEKHYESCFDIPFYSDYDITSDYLNFFNYMALALDAWVDRSYDVRRDLFPIFEKWHKEGIMHPITKEELSDVSNALDNHKPDKDAIEADFEEVDDGS